MKTIEKVFERDGEFSLKEVTNMKLLTVIVFSGCQTTGHYHLSFMSCMQRLILARQLVHLTRLEFFFEGHTEVSWKNDILFHFSKMRPLFFKTCDDVTK